MVYAVARGRRVGLFNSWAEVKKHTDRFKRSLFRKFEKSDDAVRWLAAHNVTPTMPLSRHSTLDDPPEPAPMGGDLILRAFGPDPGYATTKAADPKVNRPNIFIKDTEARYWWMIPGRLFCDMGWTQAPEVYTIGWTALWVIGELPYILPTSEVEKWIANKRHANFVAAVKEEVLSDDEVKTDDYMLAVKVEEHF